MHLLPIVERELRVAARRRSAFWVRVLAAGIAVGVGGSQLWLGGDWLAGQSVGRELFAGLTLLALAFCVAAGPVFTADVLSEEKRDGTLGLLFLTDLRAHDVVLGKLAAASVTALFSLLAVLPVVAVSLLLGGVALGEFARMVLVLVNTLGFSLAVGMAMSAFCEQARSAFALTAFVLFLTTVVAAWWIEGGRAVAPGKAGWVEVLSPVGAWLAASAPRYASDPATFWRALAGAHLVGWGWLGLAAWWTGRAWREATAWQLSAAWQARWRDWWLGERCEREALRRRLLEANPILWLGSRHRLKRRLLWGFLGVALAVWLAARLLSPVQWWSVSMTAVIAFFLQVTLKWLVASEAAFRFAEDRRNGALELLLTTGLRTDELVRGQVAAMRRLFGLPCVALLAVEALLLLASGPGRTSIDDWSMAVAAMVLFAWDMPTLAWAAMWYSVAGKRPQWAALRAIFRVLVVPWLVFLAALFVVGVWNWLAVTVLWGAIGGVNNYLVTTRARARLRAGLRVAAAGLLPAQREKHG
jgi:ABC-type transport system involved in cytochrome c biogenesis permease component